MFAAALAAADVRPLVHRALRDLALPRGRLVVVGAGKASGAMAAAVEEALGDRVDGGLVVVKDAHAEPTRRIRIVEAGHPVPDERGAAAAREIHALARGARADDLVLFLVSGGGSALTPAPVPPITLAEKQTLTRLLLSAGASINQLNAVRKHCSLLKGGQLARAAAPARVLGLLLSDVVGDPLDVIASGPTAPDESTFADAMGILARFDVRDRVPASIVARLQRGMRGEVPETPKPGDPVFDRVDNVVIGNNRLVVGAACAQARREGFTPYLLGAGVEGEARDVGRRLAALARDIREGRGPVAPPACVVAGGETTVTVTGGGTGGRCQELALAAALEVEGAGDLVVLAAGTDGTDGPTPAAGAIADGETVARARALGSDPRARLDDNDSHPLFAALGDLVATGPTRTNLLDLYVVMIGVPERAG